MAEPASSETALAPLTPSRASRTEKAILDATRELLSESGVRHLTVEKVAARSGVAKTTIYRRWRSKDELALAVLIDFVQTIVAVPRGDGVRNELTALLRGAVNTLGTTAMGRVMQGLVSELATNDDLSRAFHEQVVALRVSEVRKIVVRGIERGELRADTDVDLLHELLFGPVYYRLFLSGGALDRKLPGRIVDAVLPGFRP
ncbi:TetR/AcrR family transcriptional regulator [Acidothermaceae bacterium B102]|nr:TetR/AcrR family transcriptional regulator [Acidothermaceae bacterium B102]